MARKLNDVIYTKLPPSTRDVMLRPNDGGDADYNIVKFIRKLLPDTNKQECNRQLNEKFVLTSSYRRARPKRFKKTLLSMKERRQLGLYNLRRQDMKYKDFLPLHNLWKEYFTDYMDFYTLEKQGFIGEPGDRQWENVTRKLLRADYHGSMMTVSHSLCPHLVGKKGIVVFDTKNTIQMLSEDDVLRIVPKASSNFKLSADKYIFTILGKQFCMRPTARNTQKLKNIINLDM